MSRIKISEFRAKQILTGAFGQQYGGYLIEKGKEFPVIPEGSYVVKVDQAVKKRNKLGLVRLQRTAEQAAQDAQEFFALGYTYCLVESFLPHEQAEEHYVSLQLTDTGTLLQYSPAGGVDIEDNHTTIQSCLFNGVDETNNTTALPHEVVKKLLEVFEAAQMTYLEINPLVIRSGEVFFLDAAVEVDSAASFGVSAWSARDERTPKKEHHPAEAAVEALAATTPASLVLKVLNPEGRIFMLLSGGGASVVILDEIAALGGKDIIGNYGEYSGNPNEDETYLYAKQVLTLLLASAAANKSLLIAGGVANFTDVAKTFKGIIRALEERAPELKAQNVQVVVRRGGPNQKQGLANMKAYLEKVGIKHQIYGTETSLGRAVKAMLEENVTSQPNVASQGVGSL